MYPNNTQQGFIALMTVVIVSFTLLLVTISMNFSGFSVRFNILDSESKERSNALADACIDYARLAIAINDYSPGTEVTMDIDGEPCTYEILPGGDEIIATAEINRANTFFWVEVDPSESDIPVIGLKECEDLSPCP